MKRLLFILLLFSFSFSFQVILHYESGKKTWELTNQLCDAFKTPSYVRMIALPLSGIVTHMTTDYFFSEGYLGDYQVIRGGIKLATLILMEPTEQQAEDIQIAFWNLFPDLIDKGFNLNIFHRLNSKPMFSVDREQEEVLEDWIVFDAVAKTFVYSKVPRGTLAAVEYKF